MVTPARSQHILAHLRSRSLLSEEQLREVRAHWRGSGLPLAHSLVELGYLTEAQTVATLAELTGLPRAETPLTGVDRELLERLPPPLLRRIGAVPLGVDAAGFVRVAFCAPFDVVHLDELRSVLRRPLQLLLAPWSAIRAALDEGRSLQETVAETVVGEMAGAQGGASGAILRDEAPPEEEEPPEPRAARPAREDAVVAAVAASAPAEAPFEQQDEARSDASASAPVVRLADLILADALAQGASDIHLEPVAAGLRLRFRLQGVLRTIRMLPRTVGPALVARLKVMARLDITVRRRPQDGRLWFRSGGDGRVIDVRVSSLPTVEGEKLVLRLLDPRSVDRPLTALIPPSDLPRFLSIVDRTQGLVLVTGPTGSGKTTTLYATLRHVLTDDENFVTIEQPVEYHIDGVAQVHVRDEDGTSFAGTLRSVLRQDPDVILVGEIRDAETAVTALQAATTGHLVLSTLHTNDAASSCTRYVDLGGQPFLLADALNGVLAQRLLRQLCTACRRPAPASQDDVRRAGPAVRGAVLHSAVGCAACSGTGFKGRLAVHEIAAATPAVRDLILRRSGDGPVREALRQAGVPSMFSAGVAQVLAGVTSLDELVRCVPRDETEQTLGCPGCGVVLPRAARFCVGCGRPASDRCGHCGSALDAGWRHCGACGHARPGADGAGPAGR